MVYSKLRKLVYGHFETQTAFARHLSWPINKVNAMLNGRYLPSLDEVEKISIALDLDSKNMMCIFLPNISPNGDDGT